MPASSPPAVRERAESLLRWLEGSAAEVVLSWPAYEREEPLTPSPLIAHLPAGEAAGWQGSTRRQQLLQARTGSTLADDPPPAVSMPCRSFRGGAGLLTAQARCPARAFLQFRLGAQELREPGPGLDAATRGQIIHAVLQAVFSRITDQRQLLELDEVGQSALLEQLTAEATGRFVAAEPTLQAILREERARVAGRVAELLYAEREREPFRVAGTEVALDLARTPRSVQSLQLALRADRIDERDDGLRVVIDYKTGRTPPAPGDLHGFPLRAPQLPLYALAGDADAVAFVQVSSDGSRWIGVGRGQWLNKGLRTPEKLTGTTGQSWEVLRNAWFEAVDRLARGFLDGDFSVDRWRLEEAQGQWAMATRVHELPEAGSEQE
jgi:RecB family exonuclease